MKHEIKRDGYKAVVMLSGGQDSATCLALALERHTKVFAIGFDYGQRHSVELDCANELAKLWGVDFITVPLYGLSCIARSALLASQTGDVSAPHPQMENVPASFVPGRNALFLTLAHAYAIRMKAKYVYFGASQSDYSGYPDCRQGFIVRLNDALNRGYNGGVTFVTPLMFKTKAQTFQLAEDLGVIGPILTKTHTCYNGNHDAVKDVNAWGYGCGTCPACMLRKNGYSEFLAPKLAEQDAP